MKRLGKRILSMGLAFGLTASMLISDLSVMQVNAAGSMVYAAEEEAIDVEWMTQESTQEEISEDSAQETTSEEVSLDDFEGTTEEETIGEEETTVEETSAEESVTEETTTEEALTEEASRETTEETSEEMSSTEEGTFAEVPEETTEIPDEDGNQTKGIVDSNPAYVIGADEEGEMTVTFTDPKVTKLSGSIVIPKEVRSIPKNENYFYGNMDVTEVTFEAGSVLEEIQADAFQLSAITEIKIPASVKTIGARAFSASSLQTVTLVAGGEKIALGEMAFSANVKLSTFITSGRLESIGKSAFANNIALNSFVKTVTYDEDALEGVTVIGESAFAGCVALEYVKIPDIVTKIEANAFKGCTSLGKSTKEYYTGIKAVEIGNGVKEIGDSAFADCSGLTDLILPENVAKLGNNVFTGCTSIQKILIYNQDGELKTDACAIELTYTSFPNKKGLVLSSYDGTVKDWVGSHTIYGVKFSTLYEKYSVTYADDIKNGTVKANVDKAQMGETVTLTITPKEGYVLKHDSLYYLEKDGNGRGMIDAWSYSFEMPNYPIEIQAKFVSLDELEYGEKLILTEQGLVDRTNEEEIVYDSSKGTLEFSKPWQSLKLRVTGSNNATPGYGELVFKSDNEKIVTIDAKGNMRAIAEGSTKVTVSLADESKSVMPLELKVRVGEKTYVKDLALSYKAPKATIKYAQNEEEYDTITFPASILNVDAHSITVMFEGTDEAGDILDVTYQITSNDKKVAKPNVSKVTGEGVITIPKKTSGETVVTVKALDGSKVPVKKQFVVRVIDDKPRLADSTVVVDPQSETGTLLDLVSVYDANPDVRDLSIVTKEEKNNTTYWVEEEYLFNLNIDGDKVYIQANEYKDNPYEEGKEYTFSNIYYIRGVLDETDEEFYIAIPTLTVLKKNLEIEMKVSGKINLFYNGLADIKQIGSVTVKPKSSKTGLTIVKCELVGNTKANGKDNEDDGAFAENFDATLDEKKQTITITRSQGDTPLSCYSTGTNKGQPVISGKLRIWYEGYSEDSYYDYAIEKLNTHITAPSYKLDTTKIVVNSYATGQEFDVSFINKKTKKKEDLTEDTVVRLDQTSSGTTPGLIDPEEEGAFTFDTEEDTIHFKIADSTMKGQIVLIVRQPDWEENSSWNEKGKIKATIKVSTTQKAPTVKLGKTTLTLNAQCPAAKDSTTMKTNQMDAILVDGQEFIPKDAQKSKNIEVVYEDGMLTAAITGDVTNGTHTFTLNPEYGFMNSERTGKAKKVTVKVKVNSTSPSIKLKNTTFKVNANCFSWEDRKYDSMTRKFTWSNLPAEYSDYTLSADNVKLEYTGKGVDPLWGEETIRFQVDGDAKEATVYIENDGKVFGKSSYKVTGLELVNESTGDTIAVKSFKITVNSVNKAPSVSVKAKGTLNPLDATSSLQYTPTLTNINGTITDVAVREFDEDNMLLETGDEHFDVVQNEKGVTVLTVKEGAQLENRNYKLQLYYELSNGEDGSGWKKGWYQVGKDLTVKPKQTMPKISVDRTEATFFAGNTDRTEIFTITKKSTKTANIVDVKFSDKTSETLQNAFVAKYDPETGEMELRLKNSAFIKQNTEQTLTFEIVCEGQLLNTTGRTFTVKVKVIK